MKRFNKLIDLIAGGDVAEDGWPLGVPRPVNTGGVKISHPLEGELKKTRKALEVIAKNGTIKHK